MSGLLRLLQVKMLKQRLINSRGFCQDPVNGLPAANVSDPNIRRFLRSLDLDPDFSGQGIPQLRESILVQLDSKERRSAPEFINGLGVLLDRLGMAGDGNQLDLLFLHMTGESLSTIVDVSHVLLHPEDSALDGDHCFSLMLGVDRPGMAAALLPVSAVASTLDFLLPLIKPAITEQADRYEECVSSNVSLDLEIQRGDYRRLKPTYLVINKDHNYFTHLSVTKKPVNGYDINWASVLLSGHTRETILSLAAIAPKAISKKMKGRYLEDELGL
jgi:hypothetical protein